MVLDVNVHVQESPFKLINGSPPPSVRSMLDVHPPSALLLKFIEARKDIANYK
jgi:phenylalanine ammonia-lyase